MLGPIIEGSAIALRCESGKGRPVPSVEWYNGEKKLKCKLTFFFSNKLHVKVMTTSFIHLILAKSSSELEDNEMGTGSGTLNLIVARSELGATFTCKVNSLALDEPLKIDIKLDVHGKFFFSLKQLLILIKRRKNTIVTYCKSFC